MWMPTSSAPFFTRTGMENYGPDPFGILILHMEMTFLYGILTEANQMSGNFQTETMKVPVSGKIFTKTINLSVSWQRDGMN